MASSSRFTVNWGIMATGGIAETFCKDLLTDPAFRDVHDVCHEIIAVASSTSVERASDFIKKIDGPSTATLYGTYHELVVDPAVDIIYVATPHSHHFQNAMLALEAGKNVLCEKAFTVTASQARKLIAKAKEKNLFLMEAVWTRYFPLSIAIRELVSSGAIGRVHRTFADLSFGEGREDGTVTFPDSHRMVCRDLAGGALLDLGIYALTWVFQSLYNLQHEKNKELPTVVSAISQMHTGVDETASVICHFPEHHTVGIATTSIQVASDPNGGSSASPAIRIQGTKGEIQVMGPAYRPLQFKLVLASSEEIEVIDFPIPMDPKRNYGHGMFWEADECARCLRDGKKQSETIPWTESIAIMEVMEKVWKDGGIKYPELITTDIYDAKSPLNTGKK